MKLHAKEVIFLHRGGERLAVIALGDGIRVDRHGVAVHEVEIRAFFNAAEQTIACFGIHPVPAHVRQRQTVVGHLRHLFFDNAQQIDAVVLLAALAEQLHAQANPQHRLGTGFDQVDQLAVAQLIHRRLGGADAGKKQFIGTQYHFRIAADHRLIAVAANRRFHRIKVGAAGIRITTFITAPLWKTAGHRPGRGSPGAAYGQRL